MARRQAGHAGTGRRLMRFAAVGILNTAVDFGILNLLVVAFGMTSGMGLVGGNALAFAGASLNSYLWNKRWTFEEKDHGSMAQFLLFFVFTFGGLAVNSLVVYLLMTASPLGAAFGPAIQINLAKVCATLASMAWNYIGYRQVVFRRPVYHQQTA